LFKFSILVAGASTGNKGSSPIYLKVISFFCIPGAATLRCETQGSSMVRGNTLIYYRFKRQEKMIDAEDSSDIEKKTGGFFIEQDIPRGFVSFIKRGPQQGIILSQCSRPGGQYSIFRLESDFSADAVCQFYR
jgi:hypothetical protein